MKKQSNKYIQDVFIQLVRMGIRASNDTLISKDVDWEQLKALADEHGLSAIVLDGIENLSENQRPPQITLLEWIGEALQGESTYSLQQQVSTDIAKLYHSNAMRMYVLKGIVVSECYPKPNHRVSVDIDCFLLPEKGDFDVWKLGNDLIREKGFTVNTDFYKNSTFDISGVMVENHQYLTPFRGNMRLEKLESFFQSQFKSLRVQDNNHQELDNERIGDTWMYRPPIMVTALFLIEHAYSHFLHEGLTWRMVLDWVLFSKKHEKEICWMDFNPLIDEFGFRQFYDSYSRLGQYLIGDVQDFDSLRVQDKRMLEDIWAPLDVHETVRGVKGKLALAGNTWKARWKYRYFTEMSWVAALWIQVKGFLFEKNPTLN